MPSTRDGEVGAVIEIEAAQEVLVRLAVAAVLGDDQPRHDLEHFARAQHRAILELRGEHGADACGVGLRERFHALRRDRDFLDELARQPGGPRGQRKHRGKTGNSQAGQAPADTHRFPAQQSSVPRRGARYDFLTRFHTGETGKKMHQR